VGDGPQGAEERQSGISGIIAPEDYERRLELEHFRAHDVQPQRLAHGLVRVSMYVDDPDGYHVELTVPFDAPKSAAGDIVTRGLLQDVGRVPLWRR